MKNKINNTELTPAGLKQIFQERLDLSSTDLNKVAKSFSKLYNDYQADIVNRVTLQRVPNTNYTWIDPPDGRSDRVVLLDDSIEFYRFLRQQGHPINLQIIPDMIHCGQIFSNVYPPGEKAILSAAEFLQISFSKDM